MAKIVLSEEQKEVLLQALDKLGELQQKVEAPAKAIAKDSKPKVVKDDDGGLPSENSDYKGMAMLEALYKAREMENDAIEINLYLLELAKDDSDIKSFVEIANDENSHDKIYAAMIERLEKGGKK